MTRKLCIERLENRLALAADFNGDDAVDDLDLRNWKGNFGEPSAVAEQGDADADGDVDGSDFLDWQRDFGVKRNQLIAYRPQHAYATDDTSTPDPIYRFPFRPVKESEETSNTLGAGIRVNWDDDDLNGQSDALDIGVQVLRENDLIEVKIQSLGQVDLALVPGGPLALYYNHDKETPIPMNGNQTEDLEAFPEKSVFVEWAVTNHGFADLQLVNADTGEIFDTVRFHSFRSLIIAFGGNGQDPNDTDGDGSIGDPREDLSTNREGIFDVAQTLYNTGWDVLAFDEEEVDDPEDVPFTEIWNAHAGRFIDAHAIMGYSQGGGATHDLIERLWFEDFDNSGEPDNILTQLGVLIDAVDHDGAFAETDWPDLTFYLLNFWQENGGFMGGEMDPSEFVPPATVEEYNTTTAPGFDNDNDHELIDDDPTLQNLIRNRINGLLINR